MGFLSELKRLFFGASSVAKHTGEKTSKYIKEEADEFVDTTKAKFSQISDDVSERTSGLKQSIEENSKELYEKAKHQIEEIGDSPAVKKAAEVSEKVGDEILTAGEAIVEKGKTVSEDLGSKILDIKDDMVDKAKDTASKLGDKLSETMDKADKWAEAEKAKPKKDFADDDLAVGGSLLDGEDDFFSKASQYADGKYDSFSEGKITIKESEEKKTTDNRKATGFTDNDGDGNEIIDDAIIDDENPEDKKE